MAFRLLFYVHVNLFYQAKSSKEFELGVITPPPLHATMMLTGRKYERVSTISSYQKSCQR